MSLLSIKSYIYPSTNFNKSYSNDYMLFVLLLCIVLQSMMQFLYPYYSDYTVIIQKYHHLSAEIAFLIKHET